MINAYEYPLKGEQAICSCLPQRPCGRALMFNQVTSDKSTKRFFKHDFIMQQCLEFFTVLMLRGRSMIKKYLLLVAFQSRRLVVVSTSSHRNRRSTGAMRLPFRMFRSHDPFLYPALLFLCLLPIITNWSSTYLSFLSTYPRYDIYLLMDGIIFYNIIFNINNTLRHTNECDDRNL